MTNSAYEVPLSSSANVATRLMQVHLALIYFAMAMAQLREETWWQGTAVWWMMAKSDSRLVDLTFLNRAFDGMGLGQAFVYLINFLTHIIVLYEFCFAFLIWNSLARPILLMLGVFIWTGLALICGSVSFAILMMIASLAFLRQKHCDRGAHVVLVQKRMLLVDQSPARRPDWTSAVDLRTSGCAINLLHPTSLLSELLLQVALCNTDRAESNRK